jgi:MFS family permease
MRDPASSGPLAAGALWVLLATTAVQSLATMTAMIVPVLGPQIAPDLGFPTLALGYYVSVLYGSAIISGTLGGDLVLRYGPIRVSQAGLAGCALGMLLLASGVPWLAPVSAVVLGLAYGPTTPASSHMLAISTPPARRNLVFSIKQTGVPIGGMLAGLFGPTLAAWLGWRGALLVVALAALACGALVQPLRRPHDDARESRHRVGVAALSGVAATLRDSATLRTLALASLCFTVVQLSFTTYLVSYLHESFGYTLVAAGLLLSLGQVAGVVGRIAWGVIADRGFGAVRMVVVLAIGMAAGSVALGALAPGGSAALAATVVLLGACALGWNGTFLSEVARQAPPGGAGRATSAILTCAYGGVVVGPPLFALIASTTGSYGAGFAALAAAPAAAAVLLFRRRQLFG